MDDFKARLQHNSKRNLWPSYANLRIAMELPSKHNARELMVGACVIPYALSMTNRLGDEPRELLDLEKLTTESNDFAADLLRAYTKAAKGSLGVHFITDPLTQRTYHVRVGEGSFL
jgi:hypothetical protein